MGNSKISISLKTARHRAKWTKIWAPGVLVPCMLVFLTLNMSRSFGVIRCTFPKSAHNRVKRMKIYASGVYVTWMLVFYTLNMSRSFGVIQCTFPEIWAVTQKRLIVARVKQMKIWPRVSLYHACWYFWHWTCQGHLGSFGALLQNHP